MFVFVFVNLKSGFKEKCCGSRRDMEEDIVWRFGGAFGYWRCKFEEWRFSEVWGGCVLEGEKANVFANISWEVCVLMMME